MSQERKIYLRIFLTIILGMSASLGIIRWYAWLNDASGQNFLGRVTQAREHLPDIIDQQGDLVMFYGSSMVQAGFSARHFDREINARGGNIMSWNFGFGGLNPFFQEILSRRIRDAFLAEDRKLKLLLIEFNPFQTTQTRWNGAVPIVDSFITLLASDEELLEIAMEDPERGALLYNIKYLRDNVSAEMATTFFGEMFDEQSRESDRPGLSEEQQARLDELSTELNDRFEKEYPDYEGAAWNYGWQGAGTVPWERPADTVAMFPEYFKLRQNEQQLHDDLLFRIRSADAVNLKFEELLVESFIVMINNFKPIAENIEVILLPRNYAWIEYTPEVAARLESVISRIERETGVKVVNQQLIDEVTPGMYSDTTHLARYLGDIPYTEYLVTQYSDQLTGRSD